MCTVSFIYKGGDNFLLTSNRDEAINRTTIPPKVYELEEALVCYPKDELAGGTWIGVSSKQRLLCLLNGAFKKHKRVPPYVKSRGVVVKEMMLTQNIQKYIEQNTFEGIEPFTLIIVDWSDEMRLSELIWDENEVVYRALPLKQHVWSSSTLYTDEMKAVRRVWINEYLKTVSGTQEHLMYFHEHYGVGDNDVDLQIDRGMLKTVSITSYEKKEELVKVLYKDLLNDNVSKVDFQLTKLV